MRRRVAPIRAQLVNAPCNPPLGFWMGSLVTGALATANPLLFFLYQGPLVHQLTSIPLVARSMANIDSPNFVYYQGAPGIVAFCAATAIGILSIKKMEELRWGMAISLLPGIGVVFALCAITAYFFDYLVRMVAYYTHLPELTPADVRQIVRSMGALNFNTVVASMYLPFIGLLCGYGLAIGLARSVGIRPEDGPPARFP